MNTVYVCFIMKPAWNRHSNCDGKKPKQLTVALWKLYFNNLGVYHEWILCSIWCWMEETNWVYLYEIVICCIVAFLHTSCGGNYICITTHIFAVYLHVYFFCFWTSVWSWWIKSYCNGTRPRCKYRWWYMHEEQKWIDIYLCMAPLFKLNTVCDMWSRANNIW